MFNDDVSINETNLGERALGGVYPNKLGGLCLWNGFQVLVSQSCPIQAWLHSGSPALPQCAPLHFSALPFLWLLSQEGKMTTRTQHLLAQQLPPKESSSFPKRTTNIPRLL